MKSIFLILCLTCGFNLALEKYNPPKKANDKKELQAYASISSSERVHEMMANRDLAPHMAWMILWAHFPAEYNELRRGLPTK
jgi:hypothetical protein